MVAARGGPREGADRRTSRPEGRAGKRAAGEIPAWRLIVTLAVAGAVAGLAIVVVHGWAQPRIETHRAESLRRAIHEVLAGPEGYRTLWIRDGALVATLPPGVDSTALDRVYLGYDGEGRPVGFAVAGEAPGYQDVVGLLFGFDPRRGEVIGMVVLESRETPGLGDRIIKDTAFVGQFRGVAVPLEGVKPAAGSGVPGEVDMISGATISSRTVIEIINRRLEEVGPLLEAWADSAGRVPASGPAAEGGGPTSGGPEEP